jgi:glutamate synthase domain-containing protein 2
VILSVLALIFLIKPIITVAIIVVLGTVIAIFDYVQRQHAIRRNYPLIGWFRYLSLSIRDKIHQYFIAGKRDERPYPEVVRAYIARSAKGINNNIGYGTDERYRDVGQIHLLPSMFPTSQRDLGDKLPAIVIGKKRRKPYTCPSPINISGMSWGSISEEAVRALSSAAKESDIHMLTGEGGLTPFHEDGVIRRIRLKQRIARLWSNAHYKLGRCEKPKPLVREKVGGGRIILQLGPAKFGFRKFILTKAERGYRKIWTNELDWDKIKEVAQSDQIVGIEIKLAQGAKPGAGGKLPKEKITREIAEWRGIEMGVNCISPAGWDEFSDIPSLFQFITKLQEVTGKPVGFKMVAGSPDFIRSVAKHMKETGTGPDFITVDGGEGGTGAAPLALADMMGLPILHAIPMVDNALREFGVRDDVVLIVSGQIATSGDVAVHIAMGADMVNIGRGFLIAEGCIMAMLCHTDKCPTGIATQNPRLRRGLDPEDKFVKAANYALMLKKELIMIMRSAGVKTPWELTRHHVTIVREPMKEETAIQLYPYIDNSDGKRNPTLVTVENDIQLVQISGGGINLSLKGKQ